MMLSQITQRPNKGSLLENRHPMMEKMEKPIMTLI
jgi:hypothetical protein